MLELLDIREEKFWVRKITVFSCEGAAQPLHLSCVCLCVRLSVSKLNFSLFVTVNDS